MNKEEQEDMNEGLPIIIPQLTEDELRAANAFIPPEWVKSQTNPQMSTAFMIDALVFDGPDPDETHYLLLLYIFKDDDLDYSEEECRSWKMRIGRQATYDYLKELIETESIDPTRSYIMAESSTLKTSRKIYNFMRRMKEDGRVIDNTEFNISDYKYANNNNFASLIDLSDDAENNELKEE